MGATKRRRWRVAEIVLDRLTKRFGENKGVFGLSFEVGSGEAFGFIGPNGAGKTTAIRHLMGFLNPDAGTCQIRGMDCRTQAASIHRDLGYVPGEIGFFDEMRGEEYLRFCERIRKGSFARRKRDLLERFELDASGRIKKMSKGMKQKLGLISAFLHDPGVLVLDEPTSGLDPLMQARFVELVREEKKRGKTLLISSHSFEEIEKTCGRVGILKEGRLVAVRSSEELDAARRRVFSLTFASERAAEAFEAEGFETVLRSGRRLDVAVTGELAPFLAALPRHPVTGLDAPRQTLEEAFMRFYGERANDE
ncbi:MAG: ABC transporter ATP-binding protein [Clostridiales bacterium]|nr:ABC transporter ATP-binding protein [Clostridiales bacterium]